MASEDERGDAAAREFAAWRRAEVPAGPARMFGRLIGHRRAVSIAIACIIAVAACGATAAWAIGWWQRRSGDMAAEEVGRSLDAADAAIAGLRAGEFDAQMMAAEKWLGRGADAMGNARFFRLRKRCDLTKELGSQMKVEVFLATMREDQRRERGASNERICKLFMPVFDQLVEAGAVVAPAGARPERWAFECRYSMEVEESHLIGSFGVGDWFLLDAGTRRAMVFACQCYRYAHDPNMQSGDFRISEVRIGMYWRSKSGAISSIHSGAPGPGDIGRLQNVETRELEKKVEGWTATQIARMELDLPGASELLARRKVHEKRIEMMLNGPGELGPAERSLSP